MDGCLLEHLFVCPSWNKVDIGKIVLMKIVDSQYNKERPKCCNSPFVGSL
jgi:hypothetical protein